MCLDARGRLTPTAVQTRIARSMLYPKMPISSIVETKTWWHVEMQIDFTSPFVVHDSLQGFVEDPDPNAEQAPTFHAFVIQVVAILMA